MINTCEPVVWTGGIYNQRGTQFINSLWRKYLENSLDLLVVYVCRMDVVSTILSELFTLSVFSRNLLER